MLDLADVLELIDDRFDEGTLSQQHLVQQWHQAVFHVALDAGDQAHAAKIQSLEEFLADVTLVAKKFAEQVLRQCLDGFAVIHVAGGEANVEQFATIVGNQMQLETEEPSSRGLAALGEAGHGAVAENPQVVADSRRAGIESIKLMPLQGAMRVLR